MTLARSLCLVSALALGAGTAQAQTPAEFARAEAALNFLQRLAATYVVLVARAAVDLTYESLTIDTAGSETVINGLVLRPALDWDPEGTCAIALDRVAASSSPDIEVLESVIEITGATIPSACFDPGTGAMLASFGYPMLEVERAAITLGYDVPSSGAEIRLSADISEAADLTLFADFDYLWLTGLLEGEEPEPVAYLASAELTLENAGLWERVSPLLEGQFGDLSQLNQLVAPMLGQLLVQPGQALGAEEQAFIDNLSQEIGRFVADRDRLVLSVAPETPLLLEEGAFDTPQAAIRALNPSISSAPIAITEVIQPSVLSAAMAGGAALDDATRIDAGRALVRGLGAPRSYADAIVLLSPLADTWNAEAAALLAEALMATGREEEAYAAALKAMAGGATGAIGTADAIESPLATEAVVAAQASALADWPGLSDWIARKDAAEQAGDVPALRRLAFDASAGRAMPRSYREAYYLATLAAAGGDQGAAALRERLDRRFVDRVTGAPDPAWTEAAEAAASAALAVWTGGVAENVMTRYGRN